MQAMVVREFGEQPALQDIDLLEPSPEEILLRVEAAGVCRTDLKIRDGHVPDVPLPCVLGHEIAGTVETIGSAVTSVKVGDRGVPYGYLSCGRCAFCTDGRTSLCTEVTGRYGFGSQGGYSEYVVVPERLFVAIGDNTAIDAAAVATCSMVTPYRALVRRARVTAGETVVIVGAGGGVGLAAVQIAARMGARVIAVDADQRREDVMRSQGAHDVVVSGPDGFAEQVRELTGGAGASAVIELVAADQSMQDGVACLDLGGRLVLVGYRTGVDFRAVVPDLVFREIEILGSHWASLTDVKEVLAMIDKGLLESLVMRTYPLAEAVRALEELESGEAIGRTVLVP